METLAREFGGAPDGDGWALGETRPDLARGWAPDAAADGSPEMQTLERLIRAAVVAAYPGRGGSVQQWLEGRGKREEGPIPRMPLSGSFALQSQVIG